MTGQVCESDVGISAGTAARAALAALLLVLGGCSANVSRFDYPMFARDSGSGGESGALTTSSLRPAESLGTGSTESSYSGYGRPSSVSRSDLPPPTGAAPQSYTPPAVQSYSPPPAGPRVAAAQPLPQAAPRPAAPAPERVASPPPPKTKDYVIKRGDTLSSIAIANDSSVDAIMKANNMESTRLRDGQTIKIPVTGAAPVATARASGASRARTHVVQSGDSFYTIAKKYDIEDYKEIARVNDMRVTETLQLGQELKLPDGTASAKAEEKEPVKVANATPDMPLPNAKPDKDEKPSSASLPGPEPMTGNEFRWPVRGRIIAGFGPGDNGKHNDGINLAVPAGTSVKAAENGVVAYAGNELQGYGNLVLIRHANNWVSAYAHNEELMVKRGDTVQRGQVIAKAGKSGSVSQPQLHFELRKGSKPVDPTKFLASNS
ncbi:MAG: M23 family metallopeptidase [Pseudomonadota bacterium]|nr:M23 family metallopeptidase [Pseudomonadota bacterium]